jgi:hypothetical protein
MGVDDGDLPWETMHLEPGLDPENLARMVNEVEDLNASYDGQYTHRLVELETAVVDEVDAMTGTMRRAHVVTHLRAVA